MSRQRQTGDPRPTKGERRTRTLSIRVDADEHAEIQRRARAAGVRRLAEYLRAMALGRAAPRSVVPELNREAWLELATTSRQFAEIAARLTAGEALDRNAAEHLAALLAMVREDVRQLRLDLLGVSAEGEGA